MKWMKCAYSPHIVYVVRQIKASFQNQIIRAAGLSLNVNNVRKDLNFHPSNKANQAKNMRIFH